MKIINEKGKLFGLINVIDLVVVLILGLLIVGGVKRMQTKPIIASESSKALITFEIIDVRMPTVEGIVEGDPLWHYDKGEYLGIIAEKEVLPYTEPLESNGEWVNAEVPDEYSVIFKVEADVSNNQDVIVAGGEQTRIGIEYRLKNKKIAIMATVLGVEVLE